MRPVLLKAFAKYGARDFSDEQWVRLMQEGSRKTRFEFCEDSKNLWHTFEHFKDTLVEYQLTLS